MHACPQCDYDLSGLPDVYTCPECEFDYDPHAEVFLLTTRGRAAKNMFLALFLIGMALLTMADNAWRTDVSGMSWYIAVLAFMAVYYAATAFRKRHEFQLSFNRFGVQLDHPKCGFERLPWARFDDVRICWYWRRLRIRDVDGRLVLNCSAFALGSYRDACRCASEIEEHSRIYANWLAKEYRLPLNQADTPRS